MKEKKQLSGTRYQKAGRKEKSASLDKFISITGYKNRKYACAFSTSRYRRKRSSS
jgi:hypothetical protein